jgi:hypothetical protein
MWQIIWDWFEAHPAVWTTLVVVSALMFFGTLLLTPWLIVRIPADYFVRDRRVPSPWAQQHPAARMIGLVLKNVVGIVLILAGIAMLVLPGQGLVTILIGLMLTNFPGKFRLERWLIARPPVRRAVNWMRRRAGRAELRFDLPRNAADQPHDH